jgi:hypothetical protein
MTTRLHLAPSFKNEWRHNSTPPRNLTEYTGTTYMFSFTWEGPSQSGGLLPCNDTSWCHRVHITGAVQQGKCLTTERTNKMFWSVYWSLCRGREGDMKQGIGLTDWQNVTVSGGPIRWSTGRCKQDRNKPTTKMSGADRLRDGRGNRSLEGTASLLCFLGREKKGGAWNRPRYSFKSWFTVFNLPAGPWTGQIEHISYFYFNTHIWLQFSRYCG